MKNMKLRNILAVALLGLTITLLAKAEHPVSTTVQVSFLGSNTDYSGYSQIYALDYNYSNPKTLFYFDGKQNPYPPYNTAFTIKTDDGLRLFVTLGDDTQKVCGLSPSQPGKHHAVTFNLETGSCSIE